jgi:hypothetical protein
MNPGVQPMYARTVKVEAVPSVNARSEKCAEPLICPHQRLLNEVAREFLRDEVGSPKGHRATSVARLRTGLSSAKISGSITEHLPLVWCLRNLCRDACHSKRLVCWWRLAGCCAFLAVPERTRPRTVSRSQTPQGRRKNRPGLPRPPSPPVCRMLADPPVTLARRPAVRVTRINSRVGIAVITER